MAAYGGETGNLALKTLPFGGMYIAGGIAPKVSLLLRFDRRLPLARSSPVLTATGSRACGLGADLVGD